MREAILAELYRQGGSYISGTQLAARLGVSRVAVWKHIEALKEKGYIITAVSGKGYCLEDTSSIVRVENLKNILQTRFIAHDYRYYPCLNSTNEMAYRLLREGELPPGTMVVAGEQTGGKGRRGRHWESPRGGLWFSLVLTPALPMQQTALLSLVCAVAVCRALNEYLPAKRARIKWPNDIQIGGRKIAGILLETAGEIDAARYVIAGIGINSNIELDKLAPELRNNTTSLLNENHCLVDNTALLATVAYSLEKYYDQFLQQGFSPVLQEFKDCCCHLGQAIQVDMGNRVVEGINSDIDDYGSLVIDRGASRAKITTGDVRLVNEREE